MKNGVKAKKEQRVMNEKIILQDEAVVYSVNISILLYIYCIVIGY